jgi:hypothetical protein
MGYEPPVYSPTDSEKSVIGGVELFDAHRDVDETFAGKNAYLLLSEKDDIRRQACSWRRMCNTTL